MIEEQIETETEISYDQKEKLNKIPPFDEILSSETPDTGSTIPISRYFYFLKNNRNYRFLWISLTISAFGDWFNELAALLILDLYWKNPNAVSLFLNIRDLGAFLFGPVAGVLVDQYNRKKLLILADILRMVIVLGNLLVRSSSTLFLVFVCTFIQLSIGSIFNAGVEAITPVFVPRTDLSIANIISQSTYSSTLLFGAGLGGFFTWQFGTSLNFILDSLSYLGSAFSLSRINLPPEISEEQKEKEQIEKKTEQKENQIKKQIKPKSFFQTLISGFSFLLNHPYLLILTLSKAVGGIIWSGTDVIVVILARRELRIGNEGNVSLSLIYSLTGFAVLSGPYVAQLVIRDSDEENKKLLVVSYVLITVGVLFGGIVLETVPWLPLRWILFAIFNITRSMGAGWTWLYSSIILQKTVPNEILGRVSSIQFALFTLVSLITRVIVGFLLNSYSSGVVFIIYGIASGTLSSIWFFFYKYYSPKESTQFLFELDDEEIDERREEDNNNDNEGDENRKKEYQNQEDLQELDF